MKPMKGKPVDIPVVPNPDIDDEPLPPPPLDDEVTPLLGAQGGTKPRPKPPVPPRQESKVTHAIPKGTQAAPMDFSQFSLLGKKTEVPNEFENDDVPILESLTSSKDSKESKSKVAKISSIFQKQK